MKTKVRLADLSILVTLASSTLYIVFRNLGHEVGSFAFLWAPISLLFILGSRPATFTKGPMKTLLLYGALMVGILQYTLWKYMDDWNEPRILAEFYFLVISTVILMYYWSQGEFKKLALLSKWTFIFIIFSLITTNVALSFDRDLVRQAAATADFTSFQERIYKLTGAMGYSYAQAIVCLIPILVYHIKMKKKMVFAPIVLIGVLILVIITEIRAQVFANVLVTVVITILSFLGSKNKHISIITISLFAFLFMAVPNSFYSNMVTSISHYFDPDSEMYYKLNDLAGFLNNPYFDPSTEIGGRVERYPMLFEALAANPLSGNASYISRSNILAGAHLYWMNRLALWGIPGFLFFIIMLYKIFKCVSSLFDPSYKFYYLLSIITLILLGLTKAVGGSEPWLILIVIIPGLYFLPLLQQTQENKPTEKNNIIH